MLLEEPDPEQLRYRLAALHDELHRKLIRNSVEPYVGEHFKERERWRKAQERFDAEGKEEQLQMLADAGFVHVSDGDNHDMFDHVTKAYFIVLYKDNGDWELYRTSSEAMPTMCGGGFRNENPNTQQSLKGRLARIKNGRDAWSIDASRSE